VWGCNPSSPHCGCSLYQKASDSTSGILKTNAGYWIVLVRLRCQLDQKCRAVYLISRGKTDNMRGTSLGPHAVARG